jgi:hypothetical protein
LLNPLNINPGPVLGKSELAVFERLQRTGRNLLRDKVPEPESLDLITRRLLTVITILQEHRLELPSVDRRLLWTASMS